MDFIAMMKTRNEHISNQKLSKEKLEEKKLNKFRKLVSHASKYSEYYSRIIKENGIDIASCTPEHFPVMDKTILMENFDAIITNKAISKKRISDFLEHSKDPMDLLDNRYFIIHTSGSSGTIGYFVYSQKEWARGITHSARIISQSIHLKRKKICFLGAANGHFAAVSSCTTYAQSISKLIFDLRIYDINKPIQYTVEDMNKFQPDIIIGYAHGLRQLAHKQLNGELNISPSIIENCGEGWNELDRSVISSAFNAEMLNTYASSEHLMMGIGKQEYDGMYLLEDDLIFDIQRDCTIVTNLFNYTLPLIRYKMDDILLPKPDEKKIFPFTKVYDIIGRQESMPIFVNQHGMEDFISPIVIVEIIIKHVKAFQMRLQDKNSFVFYVVLEKGISELDKQNAIRSTEAKLMEILSKKDMKNVSFEVIAVDKVNIDKNTGKFKLILPAV